MGNLGAKQPRTKTIITSRLQTSNGNTKQEFKVMDAESVEKSLKNARSPELVKKFLDHDTHELYFSSKELHNLTTMFNEKADVNTEIVSGELAGPKSMSRHQFFEVVQLNNSSNESGNLILMNRLFDNFDTDGNGTLDLKEFLIGFSYWRDRLGNSSEKFLFAFTLFDEDRNSKLSRDEFKAMVRYTYLQTKECRDMIQAAVKGGSGSDEQYSDEVIEFVEQTFALADADGSGHLSAEEVIEWAIADESRRDVIGATPDAIRAAFVLFDKDGNNEMDKDEFLQMLLHTNYCCPSVSDHIDFMTQTTCDRLYAILDKDGTNAVDYESFKEYLEETSSDCAGLNFSSTAYEGSTDGFRIKSIDNNPSSELTFERKKKFLERSSRPRTASCTSPTASAFNRKRVMSQHFSADDIEIHETINIVWNQKSEYVESPSATAELTSFDDETPK